MATIRWVAAAAVSVVASCPTSHASNTVVVHGWLETGSSAGSYVMRAGPGEGVSLEIDDPLGRFVGSLPDYHRLTVQCKVLENSGIGIPKVEILNTHPPGTMAPTGLSCGVDAARFASCLGIPGANTGDSDGDGVPDIDDDFPFDPSEDTDTDGDGTGDNADDDDDGDEMLDTYEIANGLDPLVDDGAGDLDTDGQTNVAESVAGTAANDGSSFFGASEWMRVSPSTVQGHVGCPTRTHLLHLFRVRPRVSARAGRLRHHRRGSGPHLRERRRAYRAGILYPRSRTDHPLSEPESTRTMKCPLLALITAAALFAFNSAPCGAALNAYLTLAGSSQGEIQGSVDIEGRENTIEVCSFEHQIITERDAASGLPTGKRQHTPLKITMWLDKATPAALPGAGQQREHVCF